MMKRLSITLFTIICATVVIAQNRLHHYTVNGGLSQHSVTSVIQDKRGLLWIGTFDGLNCFDGVEFKTYRYISGDEHSLSNNRVLDLYLSESGDLWILYANNMIARYDYANDRVENMPLEQTRLKDSGNDAKNIEYRDGHLIITGKNFPIIHKIDQAEETQMIRTLKEVVARQRIEDNLISSVAFAPDGTIWLATRRGVGYVDNNREIVYLLPGTIKRIIFDSNGDLLGMDQSLFLRYNIPDKTQIIPPLVPSTTYRSEAAITDVVSDHKGTFWIGTNRGLISLNSNGHVEKFLTDFPVRAVYVDDLGVVWCGALNGLTSINPFAFPVCNFRFRPTDFAIENHVTVSYADNANDLLWVGTSRNGMSCLERGGDPIDKVQFKVLSTPLSNHSVSMLCGVGRDTLLAGTSAGLKIIIGNPRRGQLSIVEPDFDLLPTGSPFRCFAHKGKIWISINGKLYLMKFTNGKLVNQNINAITTKLPDDEAIMAINGDANGKYIWLGYRGAGLYRINLANNEVLPMSEVCANELSNPYVWSLLFDNKGKLWIGTDAGLDMLDFDCKENKFSYVHITQNAALLNDKIESLVGDDYGRIWFGTSQGVVCYDPTSKKFTTYDHRDGFQSNNFTGSVNRWNDGMLTFGGINGISSFYPSHIKVCTIRPQVNLTKFRVNDQQMTLSADTKYRFRSQSNTIYFSFASFYSPNSSNMRYIYRLAGLNDQWKTTDTRSVVYNGLPAGHYTFELKSITQDGIESENTVSVEFVVLRPAMLSVVAKIIYVLIFTLLIYFLLKNYTKRRILGNRLRFEEQLFLTEKDMTEKKLVFYTNMAHEIKTPLTLIQGPVLDIASLPEITPYISSRIKLINDNVSLLTELTEQILDFRRAVAGKLKLDLQTTDIMPAIVKIIDSYGDLAHKRGIDLQLHTETQSLELIFDEPKLIRILNNLLSNAMKFSAKGDVIMVSVSHTDEILVIEVSDTGKGISEVDLPHIFDRFYKSEKSGGSGIGLAFSKTLVDMMNGEITVHSQDGVGTTFILKFPPQSDQQLAETVKQTQTTTNEQRDEHNVESELPVILLVEDNIQLNNYLADILREHFFVIQNYDGQEAMQTLHTQAVDLLVTDVMMPRMDGIELGQKLRKFKNSAHIPIIYISAKSDIADQMEGLDAGAIDYITKPFNPQLLVRKINNILDQFQSSRRKFSHGVNPALAHKQINVLNRDEIFMRKATQIVTDNMGDEEFSVNILSELMGVSRVHLTREFNRIISQTPSDFIRSIRLNRAKELLSSGSISIKEVLWQIGIRSHSGFTRIFKEEFGYCPSEQDKKQNEESETV